MTHRRPDPRQANLDGVLRHALRLAADSVEPAAGGLDRIRSKIAARQSARARGWSIAVGAAGGAARGSRWRLNPAGLWLASAFAAVAERFRPDPNRAGWIGWLRPLAAV